MDWYFQIPFFVKCEYFRREHKKPKFGRDINPIPLSAYKIS
jgi:hypothetical protein